MVEGFLQFRRFSIFFGGSLIGNGRGIQPFQVLPIGDWRPNRMVLLFAVSTDLPPKTPAQIALDHLKIIAFSHEDFVLFNLFGYIYIV